MNKGLTQKEAELKIEHGLANISSKRMTRSNKEIIHANVFTYFNLINTILFVLVLITGEFENGFFYATIVANAIIGIVQEIKAKKIIDRMSILVLADIDVKRDGQWITMKADRIVPDDVIRLQSGLQIPADACVLSGYLEVNESMLTGESDRLIKQVGDELYAGTLITSGEAECKVVHTGKDNFSETIMADAKQYKPAKSMLQEDLQKLLKVISIVIVPTGIALFVTQYFALHFAWREAILKTISAMVGMIPEGLVVLTSVALAVSTVRLAQTEVLVQDLYSIESLARVDVLCLDKTGTLTKGTMKVNDVKPLYDADSKHIARIMGSYVRVFGKGNATDAALRNYFESNNDYESKDILPFSSDRKYAGASFIGEGTFYLGAVNFLFKNATKDITDAIGQYAKKGNRVVVLAHSVEESIDPDCLPNDLEAIALIAIEDELRDNAKETMNYFKEQGVCLKVISGDDPKTVSALALKAGIEGAESYVDMSKVEMHEISNYTNATVFGRVLPEQKKAMVNALQRKGHTVAMIGDGVNDVPALKKADVGVAMAAGASAARDSANIVLLNSEFGMMPDIVKEGRRVINNISRASSMYLVKTIFSVFLSLYVIIGRRGYPFLPIHLSLISSFGVGIPTFFLQLEPSFERVRGSFYGRALRHAFPSAITVLLIALLCEFLQIQFNLPPLRYNAILVILTCYTYLYTLYRVYYPPDKLRIIVICAMTTCIFIAMIFFNEMLFVQLSWMDCLIVVPGLFIVPVIIAGIARIYDWIGKKIRQFKLKLRGRRLRRL